VLVPLCAAVADALGRGCSGACVCDVAVFLVLQWRDRALVEAALRALECEIAAGPLGPVLGLTAAVVWAAPDQRALGLLGAVANEGVFGAAAALAQMAALVMLGGNPIEAGEADVEAAVDAARECIRRAESARSADARLALALLSRGVGIGAWDGSEMQQRVYGEVIAAIGIVIDRGEERCVCAVRKNCFLVAELPWMFAEWYVYVAEITRGVEMPPEIVAKMQAVGG
jgi:hypothetical protein